MRMKIKHIKTKIILATTFMVFFSIGISGFAIYLYVSNTLREQIIKDNSSIVTKLVQQLSYELADIRNYSLNIILNDQVQGYLKQKENQVEYDYYANIQKLVNSLGEYALLRDSIISGIYIVDSNGRVLTTKGTNEETPYEDWYQSFVKSKKSFAFTGVHFSYNTSNGRTQKVISYIEKIYDKNQSDKFLGNLIINIKYDVLIMPFGSSNASIANFFILREDGEFIYESDISNKILQEQLPDSINPNKSITENNDNHFISGKVPEADWQVIGVLPKQNIYRDMKGINLVFILIIFSCLAIMSIVIFPVIKDITKPLMTFVKGMKDLSKGRLDTKIIIRSGDEIEEIAVVFNNMVKDLNKYINELILKEKLERDMELKLFMSQINPHFIYNTLNTIIYLGKRIQSDEIVSVTKAFINILQKTIKTKPYEQTTVRSEIDYINNYASIIKYRYDYLVKVVWSVDENVLDYSLPVMLIYPLVENSMFHGLFPNGRGTVNIRIGIEEEKLRVSVKDDGVGMNREELETLVASISNNESYEKIDHIGLNNVNHRLRLLFGQACCLQLESEPGRGTNASFIIPASIC